MRCIVDGKLTPIGAITYREMGFGSDVSLALFPYKIRYEKAEILNLLRDPYNEWVSQMRLDYDATADRTPILLHELEFPQLEILLDYPEAFSTVVQDYLYIALFEKTVVNADDSDNIIWVINDISSVRLEPDSIIVEGKAFKRQR